ncbi:MAG: lipopolysaccharide biosynthesis protein [Polyangiales bacterium]
MSLQRLAGSAGMYAVAFLTPRVLRLALVPMVVAVVGLETYGVFAMLCVILPLAHVVSELGTGAAAMRLAPHEKPEDRPPLFASALWSRLLFAAIVGTAIFLARNVIARVLVGDGYGWAIGYVVLQLFMFSPIALFCDQLRAEDRHVRVAGLSALRDVLEATFTFALVIGLRSGLRGLLLGRLLADAVELCLLAWSCRSTLSARPRLAFVAEVTRIGAPIAFLYFLVLFRELDRYLIKAVLGVADVGRYDLALRIVGPVALGNAALAMVLEPYIYRTYTDPNALAAIGKFLRGYVVLFGSIAFAMAAIAPELFPLLTPDRDLRAAMIAPCLVFAFVGDGILRVAGIGADLSKRTSAWMAVAAAHLLIAFPATWFLLRPFGIFAAGAALLAGTLVSAEVARALSQRLFPMDLPVRRALVVVVIGATTATLLVGGLGFVAPLVVRLVALVVFVAVAWAIAGLPLAEVRALLRPAR